MAKLYGPVGSKNMGYKIESSPEGYRWSWVEPGGEDDPGPWWPAKREAFLDAAGDWASNGSGIRDTDALTGVLRRLAAIS